MSRTGAMGPDIRAIRKLAEDCYDSYLADLRTLVDIECGTFIPAGVNQVADLMTRRFAAAGWSIGRVSQDDSPAGRALAERYGGIVVATLEGDRAGQGGRRVLLLGHMDTVFPEGTAAARPFRVEGHMAHGPGVS